MSSFSFQGTWDQVSLLGQLESVAQALQFEPAPRFPDPRPRRVGRIIYLPVEIAARELAAKAELAGNLAKRGYQVVVGASWNIFVELFLGLPPGVVLFKTLNAHDANNMHLFQNNGHIVAVLNEEAFGLLPEPWIYRAEMNTQALRLADLICAQGERSKAVLKDIGARNVAVTGNPRSRIASATKGNDILVCMMSGNINGYLPFPEYMEMTLKSFGKADGDVLRLMREQISHESAHMKIILDGIAHLSRTFPEKRIRVRPHPSERRDVYGAGGNVQLDAQGSLVDSMKDAAVVVFLSGCGSGLESFLFGVPGVRVGSGGHGISAELHMQADTPEDISKAVAAQIESPEMIGSLAEHFTDPVLDDALVELQERNSADGTPIDMAQEWKKRADAFQPQGFHHNKFPETSDERVADLAGHPVERLGWNTWLLRN